MFEGARPALLKESIMDGVLQAGHGAEFMRRGGEGHFVLLTNYILNIMTNAVITLHQMLLNGTILL